MRSRQRTNETVAAIRPRLVPWLTAPEGAGFARPLAALVLADVARTDRVAPWTTQDERVQLVRAAADYLTNVRDYRGYDETEGWRHGVAHGADLVMQLAFNPAVGRGELELILAAVASQLAPAGHFYTYGEPNRLAAPVLVIARRGLFTPTAVSFVSPNATTRWRSCLFCTSTPRSVARSRWRRCCLASRRACARCRKTPKGMTVAAFTSASNFRTVEEYVSLSKDLLWL